MFASVSWWQYGAHLLICRKVVATEEAPYQLQPQNCFLVGLGYFLGCHFYLCKLIGHPSSFYLNALLIAIFLSSQPTCDVKRCLYSHLPKDTLTRITEIVLLLPFIVTVGSSVIYLSLYLA